MLHLISVGRDTQLHSFPDLATLHAYPHPNDTRQDMHHAPDANLFVMCNPKANSIELLRRTVKVGTGDVVQRVRKVLLDDVSCASCSWGRCQEVAIGLNSGLVQFFNIKRAELTAVKFRPENARQSVISLAYSNCNELLGSVYADGEINIFGLKTAVKMDNFHLDRGSNLIRFHPTRRYHAAIASENGGVIVMDVSAKRTVYAEKHAHTSPCPDICWSPTDPNLLLSVGYDCQLCVFDVRQRHIVHQIRHSTPFSCCTVARSAAGATGAGPFVAAGTLRGDLCAYDLRSLSSELAQRKGAQGAQVVRVAFAGDVTTAAAAGGARSDVSTASSTGAAAAAGDAAMVPNILGGGRRSMEVRHAAATATRPSSTTAVYQRRLSTEVRPGVAGGNRPSLAAVAGSGLDSDCDDDQNSFNAFLSRCTRRRESLTGGGGEGGRRDSLLDMEVRPMRFADISDGEFSGSAVAGGSSRRSSLASATSEPVTSTPPEPKTTVTKGQHHQHRRSSLRPVGGGVVSVIMEGTDDDDNGDDGETVARRHGNRDHPNVTSRSKVKAAAAGASGRSALLTSQELNQMVARQPACESPGMSRHVLDDEDAELSDKENRGASSSSPIGGRKMATTVADTLLATNNSSQSLTLMAPGDLERLIDERLAAMAARLETGQAQRDDAQAQRIAAVAARVDAMHFAVETHLWVLEDTDLHQLRIDVQETLEMVRLMSMSREFVQEFVAIKEENMLLRRELALVRGDPAPGKYM